MSQHLQTVGKIYEAFGKGDIPAILDLLDDNVAWESWKRRSAIEAGVPWYQARNGKDGAARFFEEVGKLQVTDIQIHGMMSNETSVAVDFEFAATYPATGRSYRDEEIHLWTFGNHGKVLRFRHYIDTAMQIWVASKQWSVT